ncbi:CCA tRNA nucleotidyltransferase [Garciella nitratireducens]|uniref:tRNA nucleotidyltransferase (CCA-adding enzyme) n=1 Tax=Garciella nitratireducens DSM 15102 TaxID=1121911 RepID=A0A1T4NWP9_9FIRM|nr:CCA tRNA nucleotidyltransferase [Garciella nitratireducens]SJZ83780.1 tRNA nucleotidyltransferase (CCA-adding enzyme) [Garciella nitratireducens DSM 15102]
MYLNMPEGAQKILNLLSKEGYEGYLVGGCIRDFLLGKDARDWDITTNAAIEDLINIFEKQDVKVIPLGVKNGTIVIILKGDRYEITTFRKRSQPMYHNPLEEDLSLRDFTINAMAYHPSLGIIDYFGGKKDLKERVIRVIEEKKERLEEDPLRILRAVRLSVELDFSISPKSMKELQVTKDLLKNISKERIREELNKILLCEQPSQAIRLLAELQLLDYIIPELKKTIGFDQRNPHHTKDIFEHTLAVLDNTSKDLILRLAALLHDIGKPDTFFIGKDKIGHFYNHQKVSMELGRKILKRLRYSKKTIDKVSILIKEHMFYAPSISSKGVRRFIHRIGTENLERFFQLQRADVLGAKTDNDLTYINQLEEKCKEILKQSPPLTIKDLNIDGYDLIKIGVPQGPKMKKILEYLLNKVLENPELNEKEKLMEMVERII